MHGATHATGGASTRSDDYGDGGLPSNAHEVVLRATGGRQKAGENKCCCAIEFWVDPFSQLTFQTG